MRHSKTRSNLLLVVLLIAGGWLGNYLGSLAATLLPVVGKTFAFGVTPFVLDVDFLKVTLGAMAQINPLGLLGIIIAVVVWMRT